MRRGPFVVDVVSMAALCVIALVPLGSAYRGPDFWIAGVGGVVLGTSIAAVAAVLRWRALTVAALAVSAYFVFGGVLVFREASMFGVVPTLPVLASLAIDAVQVWKQSLTLQTPFVGFADLGVAPYLAGLLASVVATSLALRLRRYGFALIPPAVLLVFAVIFSTYDAGSPAIAGAAAGGVALGWAVWRRHAARVRTASDAPVGAVVARRSPLGPLLSAAGMLAAVVVVGATAATAAPLGDRQVLRDQIVPPLELHDYASPLTDFRKYAKDGADTTLFTVSGLPEGARVRLAALDLYDGIVYQVSGSGGAGSGVFSRIGREVAPVADGASAHVRVEVGDLRGVWLPTAGYLTSIAFDDESGAEASDALHYNSATGTAIVTTGVLAGSAYEFDTVLPVEPDAESLLDAQVSHISTPDPQRVPDELLTALDAVVADATSPVEQVRSIEAFFQTDGFFSHGLDGEVASRSGHGVSREADLFADPQMIGDDEQYAVAMALMVSQLGIPVRVVMGFSGENATGLGGGTVGVTGDDLHAWVEVPFEGLGWVSFWPTPAEDKVPQEQTPQERQKPRVQVAQPPDQPQEPAELPPAPPVEEAQHSELPADLGWLWATLRIGGLALLLLAVLLGPSAALAIARARRRRRRASAASSSARVDGGWAELVDAATDVSEPLTGGATRREQGSVLEHRFPGTGAAALSVRADAAVFGAGEPTPAEVEAYWADVRTATRRIERTVPWHRRLRAALFPRSVLRRGKRRHRRRRTEEAS